MSYYCCIWPTRPPFRHGCAWPCFDIGLPRPLLLHFFSGYSFPRIFYLLSPHFQAKFASSRIQRTCVPKNSFRLCKGLMLIALKISRKRKPPHCIAEKKRSDPSSPTHLAKATPSLSGLRRGLRVVQSLEVTSVVGMRTDPESAPPPCGGTPLVQVRRGTPHGLPPVANLESPSGWLLIRAPHGAEKR